MAAQAAAHTASCCCCRVKWYCCDECGRLEREPAAHVARIWTRRFLFCSTLCYHRWLRPPMIAYPEGELYWASAASPRGGIAAITALPGPSEALGQNASLLQQLTKGRRLLPTA